MRNYHHRHNDLIDRKVWNKFKNNKWKSKYKLKPHSTTDIKILKARYTSLTDFIKSKNQSRHKYRTITYHTEAL